MTAAATKTDQLLFLLRAKDTSSGISRETLTRMSDTLGYTETQVMHWGAGEAGQGNCPGL